jgi:hypothetical protein
MGVVALTKRALEVGDAWTEFSIEAVRAMWASDALVASRIAGIVSRLAGFQSADKLIRCLANGAISHGSAQQSVRVGGIFAITALVAGDSSGADDAGDVAGSADTAGNSRDIGVFASIARGAGGRSSVGEGVSD